MTQSNAGLRRSSKIFIRPFESNSLGSLTRVPLGMKHRLPVPPY